MLDAACARYGHADIHKLRGKERLTYAEKFVFNECVKELMDAEFNPRDLTSIFGGAASTSDTP
jgi:hypothetical protein